MAKQLVCQSCRAPVVFVASAKTGRRMILDAKPAKAVAVTFDSGGGYVVGKVGEYTGVEGFGLVVDVYTDHHATCSASKAWAGHNRKDPPPSVVQEMLG